MSLEGSHVAIVAARDIWEGEELFMAYGAGYWVSRLGSEQVAHHVRLRC